MKTILVIGDGMADMPQEALSGKTPLEAAATPCMDALCARGLTGRARTIPEGVEPGSDTGILSLLGYDPRLYYTGRSPLEAAGAGITLEEGDASFRANIVSLEGDGPFGTLVMRSHSGGGISVAEADALTDTLLADPAFTRALADARCALHPNGTFRPLAVFKGFGVCDTVTTPPHDIAGRRVERYLPGAARAPQLLHMMELSHSILNKHPVNDARRAAGHLPANSLWFWGGGGAARLPSFESKRGVRGNVVTAVPLVRGIGALIGLTPIPVQGATGMLDTNCEGKVAAALGALKNGAHFVVVHVEAPDEMSHDGSLEHKLKAIEMLDARIVRPLAEGVSRPFRLLVAADHYTLLSTRTHDATPVPYFIYDSGAPTVLGKPFSERGAAEGGLVEGHTLMDMLLGG